MPSRTYPSSAFFIGAIAGHIVDRNSTPNFSIGAFLLAPCEIYRCFRKQKGSAVK